jgi:hypothetical protein
MCTKKFLTAECPNFLKFDMYLLKEKERTYICGAYWSSLLGHTTFRPTMLSIFVVCPRDVCLMYLCRSVGLQNHCTRGQVYAQRYVPYSFDRCVPRSLLSVFLWCLLVISMEPHFSYFFVHCFNRIMGSVVYLPICFSVTLCFQTFLVFQRKLSKRYLLKC